MDTEVKSIFKSKTFWLGVINVVIGVLQYIGGSIEAGTGITLNGILIILLRVVTNQPVRLK